MLFDLTENKGLASMEPLSPIPPDLADKLFGFSVSQAIITSCNLGIFDILHNAQVPRTAKEIAVELKTDCDATERLLDTLCSLELVKKEVKGSIGPIGFYSNMATADKFLVENSVNSIKGVIPMLEKSYKLHGHLESAVREGSHQWRRNGLFSWIVFMFVDLYTWLTQTSSWDMFYLIYATKRGLKVFLEGLRGSCKPEAERLMSAFDLSKYPTMCDLGGGTGDMAYAAGNLYPNMRITVFDLPGVVQQRLSYQPSTYECAKQNNINFKAGDFFKDRLPKADLYVLTRILQSFDEAKIIELLTRVHSYLLEGGSLVICEKVLDDDKSGPLLGNLSSLSLLVAGNIGSRERSGEEYKNLLIKCGFCNIRIKRNVGTFMDTIIADRLNYL